MIEILNKVLKPKPKVLGLDSKKIPKSYLITLFVLFF